MEAGKIGLDSKLFKCMCRNIFTRRASQNIHSASIMVQIIKIFVYVRLVVYYVTGITSARGGYTPTRPLMTLIMRYSSIPCTLHIFSKSHGQSTYYALEGRKVVVDPVLILRSGIILAYLGMVSHKLLKVTSLLIP